MSGRPPLGAAVFSCRLRIGRGARRDCAILSVPTGSDTMQENFELLWRRARALENDGKAAAAKDIYQNLIEDDPERLYVRIRLSAIEQGAGNYRGALEHAVRCAESVRKSRWKDMADVTRLLMAYDERALVRDLIMGTDWSHPDIIRNSVVLSQHLWLIGEVADALRLMDVAMAHGRPSAALSTPGPMRCVTWAASRKPPPSTSGACRSSRKTPTRTGRWRTTRRPRPRGRGSRASRRYWRRRVQTPQAGRSCTTRCTRSTKTTATWTRPGST